MDTTHVKAILQPMIDRAKPELWNEHAITKPYIDAETLGVLIAHWAEWDCRQVVEVCMAALEDANCSTECEALEAAAKRMGVFEDDEAEAPAESMLLDQQLERVMTAPICHTCGLLVGINCPGHGPLVGIDEHGQEMIAEQPPEQRPDFIGWDYDERGNRSPLFLGDPGQPPIRDEERRQPGESVDEAAIRQVLAPGFLDSFTETTGTVTLCDWGDCREPATRTVESKYEVRHLCARHATMRRELLGE